MALLMMRGEPVLNALDYIRLFDVYDALRGRAELASFARTHLRLDGACCHHADMIRRACRGEDFGDRRDFYWAARKPEAGAGPEEAGPDPREAEAALALYDRTAGLAPAAERLRICAAATAAVLLAWRAADRGGEIPTDLDADLALAAWQGKETRRKSGCTAIGGRLEGNLVLEARKEAYRLPALAKKPEKLRLATLRIDVLPVSGADGSRFARLEAGTEAAEVPRGGRLYVNVQDGLVTHLLPDRVRNGDAEMAREGNELVLDSGSSTERFPAEGVTSFAPEAFEGGRLLVRDGRLDTSGAWRRSTDPGLQWLENRSGAVEVQTRGQYYLVLLANGRVVSDCPAWDGLREIVRLDDITSDTGAKR